MDVTREDCQKCPYEPGIICKNCDEQEKRDTRRLCHMLIDALPVMQLEKAYLLLNRLYCGVAVTVDDCGG